MLEYGFAKDKLADLYITKKLSVAQISVIHKCSENKINYGVIILYFNNTRLKRTICEMIENIS